MLGDKGALTRHKQRAHGAEHPAQRYAAGSFCHSCCTEFHSRPRLVLHLRHSSAACLRAWMAALPPLDDQVLSELRAAEKEERGELRAERRSFHKAWLPAVHYPDRPRLPAVDVDEGALEQAELPQAIGMEELPGGMAIDLLPPVGVGAAGWQSAHSAAAAAAAAAVVGAGPLVGIVPLRAFFVLRRFSGLRTCRTSLKSSSPPVLCRCTSSA